LNIVEHTLRPQEILGAGVFERPETLAPDITRLSDRAMLLTRFAATSFDEGDEASFDLELLHDSLTAGNRTATGTASVAYMISADVTADAVGTEANGADTPDDTAGAEADAAADTAGAVADTTLVAEPDTSSARPDTTTGRADTTGTGAALGRGPGRLE
jgi:hypothetical protein